VKKPFNIMIVGQSGRLEYEALLFVASLRTMSPGFSGKMIVAEPQPGDRWHHDPRISAPVRARLEELGAEIASMKRENTWPQEELYWPGYGAVWRSLYDKFGLDFESSLDPSHPDEYWQRYMYFNAGWFLGACPKQFGERFTDWAVTVRDDRPAELVVQSLDPWLDQVVLPLVIHSFGGGRPGPELDGLDGHITCHYRVVPLFYARESDHAIAVMEAVAAPNKNKKLLKLYNPFKRMIFQGRGQKVRALFDRDALPRKEAQLRNKIKAAGFWVR